MKRYMIGAMYGAMTFAATYGLIMVGVETSASRIIHLRNLTDLIIALSVINLIVLLTVQGPILLALRRLIGRRLSPMAAVLTTLCLAPVGFFAAWLIFREGNETIWGLFTYIRNIPGEFTINLIPNIVSAGMFATWILSATRPNLAQSQKPTA